MDTSKLSTGQLTAAVGGVVLIVSLFLNWVSGVTVQVGAASITSSGNAFDVFSGMHIIMLLVGIAAISWAAAGLLDLGSRIPYGTAWVLTVSGLVVFGWALGWNLEESSAGVGGWLAMFASLAIAYGGYSTLELRPRVAPRPRTTATGPPRTAETASSSRTARPVRRSQPPPTA